LVLGRPGAQGLLEIVPEPEQAIVEHLEEPARVVLAAAHQEARTLGGVRVARAGPVSLAIEDAKRDQRVEEVGDGAGMKAEALAELLAGERSVPELVEEVKLGGDEQHLRAHEAAGNLNDPDGRELFRHDDLLGGRSSQIPDRGAIKACASSL